MNISQPKLRSEKFDDDNDDDDDNNNKYMGKEFNIMERRTGLKTSTNKIQVRNGAQYVKKTLQRH